MPTKRKKGKIRTEKNRRQFRSRVLSIVARIPRGATLSYGAVAKRAGNSKAARAVGTILKANKSLTIPCHRVIHADGRPGGYNGIRRHSKIALLRAERAPL